jgi:SNF2 family DNA or RNA helicase
MILADEPGLGKTNQLLMAAEGRTLVVAPAMLEDTWCSTDPDDLGEIARWRPDMLEDESIAWVSYSSLCGRGPDKNGRMTVPLTTPQPEFAGPWDTLILDESHYVKERKTRWTQAVQSIRTDQLYMATGTALPNWAHEIFTSLQLLYPEDARPKGQFGSYWRWADEWFKVTQNRFNAQARDVGGLQRGLTWEDFATGNRLSGRWLRRLRDDVLPDLPPLSSQVLHLEMTPEQAKIYRQVRKDLYARIEETGNEIISWSKSGIYAKLLKMTTGIECEDEDYPKWGNKISAVRELMVGRTHPTLLFCMFRSTARKLYRALSEDGFVPGLITGDYTLDQRQTVAKQFRTGDRNVLIGTFGAMAEGLNFTQADTVIFVERDARPSKNEQAVRRIHRFGQERPCLSINLVTKKSVDAEMIKWLAEKTDQQMAAMTAFDFIQAA